MEVTVSITELRDILTENRDRHRAQFEEAVAGYTKAMIRWHRAQARALLRGSKAEQHARFPVPEEHTGDYDTMIGMLNMSVDPSITLSFREYQNFVQDRWSWSDAFTATHSVYAVQEH